MTMLIQTRRRAGRPVSQRAADRGTQAERSKATSWWRRNWVMGVPQAEPERSLLRTPLRPWPMAGAQRQPSEMGCPNKALGRPQDKRLGTSKMSASGDQDPGKSAVLDCTCFCVRASDCGLGGQIHWKCLTWMSGQGVSLRLRIRTLLV